MRMIPDISLAPRVMDSSFLFDHFPKEPAFKPDRVNFASRKPSHLRLLPTFFLEQSGNGDVRLEFRNDGVAPGDHAMVADLPTRSERSIYDSGTGLPG